MYEWAPGAANREASAACHDAGHLACHDAGIAIQWAGLPTTLQRPHGGPLGTLGAEARQGMDSEGAGLGRRGYA